MDLDYHIARKHSNITLEDVFTCALCQQQFPDYYALRHHKGSVHGVSIHQTVTSEPDLSIYREDNDFKQELSRVKHLLGYYFKEEKHQITYNFPLNESSHEKLEDYLDYIFERLPCAVKLNIYFGFMLRNQETDEFRYFYADKNNPLFSSPVFIRDPVHLAFLKDRVEGEDFFEYVTQQRPNTKWRYFQLTNVTFRATLVRDIPLGCLGISLPDWLRNHNLVHCHTRNHRDNSTYNDSLCLFRGLARHYDSEHLETKTAELFSEYLQSRGLEAKLFRGIKLSDIHLVEDLFWINIVVYTVEQVESRLRGELIHRTRGFYDETVTFIRYDRHMCYVSDLHKVIHDYVCPHCGTLFHKPNRLTRHLLTCSDRDKHIYRGGPYVLSRTIFEQLEEEGIVVPEQSRYYPFMAVFDFEAICRASDDINDTECISFIGKHVPISVSIANNLEKETRFIVNKHPHILIKEFVESLEQIAVKSKIHMMERLGPYLEIIEGKILGVEQEIQARNSSTDIIAPRTVVTPASGTLIQLPETSPDIDSDDELLQALMSSPSESTENNTDTDSLNDFIDGDNPMGPQDDIDADFVDVIRRNYSMDSDQELKTDKTRLRSLRNRLKRYMDDLIVFGFNSSRYDLNLIQEYLIPYLSKVRNCKVDVIKKTNSFVSLEFLNLKFLDILNFLGGATSLDSFLKAYQTSETKGFFPYEWFDSPDKLDHTTLPPYEDFFSKLKNCNPLEADWLAYQKLLSQGKTPREALKKLKLRATPSTGAANYEYIQQVWTSKGMNTFTDFVRWYNNKDVEPTLEALEKMSAFYHEKQIDFSKLGCTLPNLANRVLHQSTKHRFYLFGEQDKDLDEIIRSNIVGGPSIVFTRYAKVGETKIRQSDNVCQSIEGIDASQLYPYSMCQNMPTGIYTRYEYDSESELFKPRSPLHHYFEEKVLNYYQQHFHSQCGPLITLVNSGYQKRIGRYFVDGYCARHNVVIEAMGCYFHGCSCKDEKMTTPEQIAQRDERRQHDNERRNYIRSQGLELVEMWECQWRREFENKNSDIYKFVKKNYTYKYPMSANKIKERVYAGDLFGILQCDIHIPERLRNEFANFPPIFKNVEVSRDDIGDEMKQHAIQNKLLTKPRKMLISSFFQVNGCFITPLIQFLAKKGAYVTRVYRFIEYIPVKCFKGFVQTAVDARRAGDDNSDSVVMAETMKLLANSSYGYQIMNREKHRSTHYANDSNVDAYINKKTFYSYSTVADDVYEVTNYKGKVDHKEPIAVGFFILQYAKLRMLELYYNFLVEYCDTSLFEEIEMDTDSLYLAMARPSIVDCIRPNMLEKWNFHRARDCRDDFEADAVANFLPRTCCDRHKKYDKRTQGLFKTEFKATEMVALCSKTYCCMNADTSEVKFSSKGLNKNFIDEPLPKYRRVLENHENLTSTNRGFRFLNGSVRTYEQTKKGLAYFYPKRKVRSDGIHTDPLDL